MNVPSVFFLFLLLAALAPAAVRAQTQAAMNAEACADYERADAELNRVYQWVMNAYRDDSRFTDRLRTAQRAWLTYRDAELKALYPAADPSSEYGSAYGMCRCTALAELTVERTEHLRRWADGVEEGDICAGSVRIKE